MHATQFGFDLGAQQSMTSWADLTWNGLTLHDNRCVRLDVAPPTPTPAPGEPAPPDPPVWGRDSADMARIAFQQPFQLAFAADRMLGTR